jgi:ankyrin repeat protein
LSEQFLRFDSEDSLTLLKEMARCCREDLKRPVYGNWSDCFENQDLPLHFALRGRLPYDAIKIIVAAGPYAARKKNGNGDLPLYVACSRDCGPLQDEEMLRCIELLVTHFPQSAKDKRAVANLLQDHEEGGPKAVRFLLEQLYPSLREPGKWSPIQAEIASGSATEGFLYCLSRRFPETLCTLDEDGSNAIHFFSENPPSYKEVFKSYVSRAGAGAVRVKDKSGELPLHKICYSDSRLRLAKTLVEAYPEAIRIPDGVPDGDGNLIEGWGRLPLHLACGQNPELDHSLASELTKLIRYLVDLYPEALNTKDSDAFLPLHWGCYRGGLQVGAIEYLVEHHPASIQTPIDFADEQWLPVFLAAIKQDAQLDTVFFLMQRHPEAIASYRRL